MTKAIVYLFLVGLICFLSGTTDGFNVGFPPGSCAPTTPGPSLSGICGDVNNDGLKNSADLTALSDYLKGNTVTKFEPSQSDVNPQEDFTYGTTFPPIIGPGDYFALNNDINGTPALKPIQCQALRTDKQAPLVQGISANVTTCPPSTCEPWKMRSFDSAVYFFDISDACYSPSSGTASVSAVINIPGTAGGDTTYTLGRLGNTDTWFSPSITPGEGSDGLWITIKSVTTTDGAGNSYTFTSAYTNYYSNLFLNSRIGIYAGSGG